ncbi:hypothetical protein [Desulforhopalus singaporensis]|uniref:Uncharacterized protein n=1 Tax=Desulforhopalus singaporensis TaxID=91360 RepID=A0A1H0SEL5_9BACT|nr:hypothetical protein [Desulforhopalus singaporensis]SDP39616.1 hypothetical protein SAMN05660330_02634 [Desulforhopalus singaporensis]
MCRIIGGEAGYRLADHTWQADDSACKNVVQQDSRHHTFLVDRIRHPDENAEYPGGRTEEPSPELAMGVDKKEGWHRVKRRSCTTLKTEQFLAMGIDFCGTLQVMT